MTAKRQIQKFGAVPEGVNLYHLKICRVLGKVYGVILLFFLTYFSFFGVELVNLSVVSL